MTYSLLAPWNGGDIGIRRVRRVSDLRPESPGRTVQPNGVGSRTDADDPAGRPPGRGARALGVVPDVRLWLPREVRGRSGPVAGCAWRPPAGRRCPVGA